MVKVSQKKAKEIIEMIDKHNHSFKNAYFFTPPGGASNRRAYEKNNTIQKEFYFVKDRKRFEIMIDFSVNCSCRNVYINKLFKLNGAICNITKLRNLGKKL